ncbi:MAG: hypothetical protein VB020_04535 [Methanocorpusculum sp.]|nr:hypothetical protein [Methanocorpusculum sp.]
MVITEKDPAACRLSGAAFVVLYIGFTASNSYFQGHGSLRMRVRMRVI